MVMHLWPACYEFEPLKTRLVEKADARVFCGVSRWCGGEIWSDLLVQVSSLLLDGGSKLRDPLPVTLAWLYRVNIPSIALVKRRHGRKFHSPVLLQLSMFATQYSLIIYIVNDVFNSVKLYAVTLNQQ
ncbi:hypothetical protein TNCV_3724031 [Trichonephila clavipes]|nr:hypothetical protein TNCV_3724031 [Trichonephila clavipes]